ncbi:MAG TPA: hypothetical protein VEX13_12390 [Chloroflexia bacterium]|nr:hypothetical protein [Chloroflexia bacterium]
MLIYPAVGAGGLPTTTVMRKEHNQSTQDSCHQAVPSAECYYVTKN